MKKTLLIVAIAGLAMASCKKDRECECTTTTVSSGGTTTTSPATTTTVKDVKGGEMKSMCQKTTYTWVNASGATSSQTDDCKIK